MVFEDNKDLCKLLQESLQSKGYQVSAFSSAAEVMSYLDSKPEIDIACVDLADRTDLNIGSKIIDRLNGIGEATIVLMSGSTNMRQLKKIKADYIIKKPFSFKDLESILAKIKQK